MWKDDEKSTAQGYSRLPESLEVNEVVPLDHSRVLLLPAGKPPELVDLKGDSPPIPLPQIGASADVLGWFGSNILIQWNGANQILVRELRGMEFIPRGVIALDSSTRPTGCAYNATRQLLAWTEEASPASVYVTSLAAIRSRIELKSDLRGLVPPRFSENGNYLVAYKIGGDSLRAWNIEARKVVASINEDVKFSAFAAAGQVLVTAINKGNTHEICFYDLDQPGQIPRRFPGREESYHLAVSPDGGVVAASTTGGQVRLFDPRKGELTEPVHGHLNAAFGLAFSADGRRLVSAGTGREAVKLWDVGTRQELLTLGGTGSILHEARWSADGDVILAGSPWQAWRAPSWEEIAAAEAKEKESTKPQ